MQAQMNSTVSWKKGTFVDLYLDGIIPGNCPSGYSSRLSVSVAHTIQVFFFFFFCFVLFCFVLFCFLV